jgi:hypothetical protein
MFNLIDFSYLGVKNNAYVGLSKGNFWLAKKEVNTQFIGGVVQFVLDGDDIDEKKGILKKVKLSKDVNFNIVVTSSDTKVTIN